MSDNCLCSERQLQRTGCICDPELAECSTDGHSFDVVLALGSFDPKAVLCINCGTVWAIEVSP